MDQHIDKYFLDRAQTALVVVDIQERLVPAMPQKIYRRILKNVDFLLQSARLLQLPVVGTEQYPRGIGHMVPELADACRDKRIEKVTFGSCGEPTFVEHMKTLKRRQALIVGMEAHVCVYQTVLGLLKEGYEVHLVRDAIMSRNKVDFLNALDLARDAGAVVTTAETAVFQLMHASTIPEFKQISALVKGRTSDE
jgi:nicotinamidase-related amidase